LRQTEEDWAPEWLLQARSINENRELKRKLKSTTQSDDDDGMEVDDFDEVNGDDMDIGRGHGGSDNLGGAGGSEADEEDIYWNRNVDEEGIYGGDEDIYGNRDVDEEDIYGDDENIYGNRDVDEEGIYGDQNAKGDATSSQLGSIRGKSVVSSKDDRAFHYSQAYGYSKKVRPGHPPLNVGSGGGNGPMVISDDSDSGYDQFHRVLNSRYLPGSQVLASYTF
jgi:hypothetical protein